MRIDYGMEAQLAAEAHLEACTAWVEDYEGAEEDPAAAPFCGCHTCIVREVLFAAWPIMERSCDPDNEARVAAELEHHLARDENLLHDLIDLDETFNANTTKGDTA